MSALPLALPLFDLEPIHGSAVARGDDVILILGAAGAGKSSIAVTLARLGWTPLADDTCAIDARGRLWPALPLLASRGEPPPGTPLGRFDEKIVTYATAPIRCPLPVSRTVILRPKEETALRVECLTGRGALTALLGQVRSPHVLRKRRSALQLAVVAHLAMLRVTALSYAPELDSIAQTANVVAEWAS